VTTLLIRHASVIATMDDSNTLLRDGAIRIVGNRIDDIGPADGVAGPADETIDADGLVLIPGLVNTHHHFYQTLTRNLPAGQDSNLFDWLVTHYPIWSRINAEAIRVSTKVAMAELMLTGCTTAADHTYMWPNGASIDDQIAAAGEMGMRFHASRGSMTVGRGAGGLPPDDVVEPEDAVLVDCQRAIERYHDPGRYAMTRIVLAPCSPFSVSETLMRETARMARHYAVHLHTHLAETLDEARFCRERFGRTPVEYAESLEWIGDDVWFAHMVHPGAEEIDRLGRHRCGVAHCPSSNMRLASGIAPIRRLRDAGARVGLGVDGSASNDSSHMLMEARQALLLQRVGGDPAALSAVEALGLATRGGAAVLGRDDIGQLSPGMAADIAGFRLDDIALAGGAVHDPLAALVFCIPPRADFLMIDGRTRIRNGELLDLDVPALVRRHNDIALALVS